MSATARKTAPMPEDIRARKGGTPIVSLTACTTPMAEVMDGICDFVLVGDSLGMVLHGLSSTLDVTLEMMILHGKAVRRGLSASMLVVDMPFGSYEESPQQAFQNASRVMRETGAGAVKLEGGVVMADTIAFLTKRGIPVMAHIGLTPQSINTLGGYKVQGRGPQAEQMMADARAVEEAGAFAVVLEKVPESLANTITAEVGIPTIGIGASAQCDGQILVVGALYRVQSQIRQTVRASGRRRESCHRGLRQRGTSAQLPRARACFFRYSPESQKMTPPIIRALSELRDDVYAWKSAGESVAVVPTMGALHQGHLSLVRAAKEGCDRVIVTIFINPKQFNNPEDYENYPRTEEEDARKLAAFEVDAVYVPDGAQMYPDGFATTVSVAGITDGLCGAHRPGHFDGVATIVTKLFTQTMADRAYFGEKDYQQLQVVTRLAKDLDLPIEVVGCPTIREEDGLAMSSRNLHLSDRSRTYAPELNAAMEEVAEGLRKGQAFDALKAAAIARIERAGFTEVEYLDLRAADTLEVLETPSRPARLLAAAWLAGVRLIDNIAVN